MKALKILKMHLVDADGMASIGRVSINELTEAIEELESQYGLMTKTDLYNRLAGEYNDKVCTIPMKKVLDEFFSQNVVIPKGENRHPYAEELHAWVEGFEVEALFRNEKEWRNVSSFNCLIVHDSIQYRIKPSETVYEWQWLVINKHNNSVRDFLNYQNYMTVLEASNHYVSRLDTKIYNIVKIEETKRERHEKH